MISKNLLLGSAHEFAKSKSEGRGQRIGDLNSYIHLTQFDRTDVCAVHIGSLRKIFLREVEFLPCQADRSPKGDSRDPCCLRHAILLVS
jgi:hypothetical protein